MTTRKRRRLAIALAGLAALGVATALVLAAFRDNLVFFFSPSEVGSPGTELEFAL